MPNIYPLVDMKSLHIGAVTRVWQYSVILDGTTLGENCNICAHTLIEGNVLLGDDMKAKSGVYLWGGTRIEDDVFIGPNATSTNDVMPHSKVYPPSFQKIIVRQGASIGANAAILSGVITGRKAMVGAGAVVTRNVPENAVVVGNPARIIRYIGS